VRRWLHKDPGPNIFDVLTTAINIMEMQITATRLATDPPDLLIQPRLGNIRFLEYHRAQEAIDEGYREATTQLMEKLKGAAAINLQQDPVSGRTKNGI
jgi:NTE family protein